MSTLIKLHKESRTTPKMKEVCLCSFSGSIFTFSLWSLFVPQLLCCRPPVGVELHHPHFPNIFYCQNGCAVFILSPPPFYHTNLSLLRPPTEAVLRLPLVGTVVTGFLGTGVCQGALRSKETTLRQVAFPRRVERISFCEHHSPTIRKFLSPCHWQPSCYWILSRHAPL